jgi:hypothetical protein
MGWLIAIGIIGGITVGAAAAFALASIAVGHAIGRGLNW